MAATKRFVILWFPLLLAACTGPAPADRALTVAEIWEDPPRYGDQTVRVQGRAEFLIEQTLALCEPARCDCNRSGGHLSLLDEEDAANGRRDRAIWIATTETGLQCNGNECELVCQPFDPRPAEALELVGRLRVQRTDGDDYHLVLDDLDVDASRRQVAGKWEPIPIETITITLREP